MRFWLIVLFVVFGLIPCLASYVWTVKTSEQRAISVRTAEIQNQCTILSNQLNSYQYLTNPSSEVIDANLTQLTNIYNGRVMIINQNLDVIKDTYGLDEGKTMVSENVIRCLRQGKSTSYYDKKNRYVEVTAPVISEEKAVTGVMLASVSMDTVLDGIRMLRAQGGAVLIVVFLVVLSLGILVAGWFVRPLGRITASIENVTEGYESEWLHVGTFSETGQLSDAFNKMLGRLKQLNDSREEFVSNVSHELKTPLTSMKVLADSLLAQENVPIELYQEFMGDIAKEIDRENDIINDLLTLVKMDKTAQNLNISQVNVNDLLELILKRLRPIAEKKQIEIVLESFRPVTAEIDENANATLLSRKLQDKIDKYKAPGGYEVKLSGDATQTTDMLKQMGKALALGFMLIYLVMVAQFQSLLSPFIVIFTVPLAFTGGMIGLGFFGMSISAMALMGFMILMGTVVNNGIVFVDYVNQLRIGGMSKREALIETGKTRMRPILMTALTTILSMSVMVFSQDAGNAMQKGMAVVVAFGLLYATLMTLFIVPVMYDILYRKQKKSGYTTIHSPQKYNTNSGKYLVPVFA